MGGSEKKLEPQLMNSSVIGVFVKCETDGNTFKFQSVQPHMVLQLYSHTNLTTQQNNLT